MALGLILSSSDFNILDVTTMSPAGSQVPSNFLGGVTGSAALNSALASPLTNAGFFSRQFALDNIADGAYGAYYISHTVDSSVYSGSISTSKAYSMRAWLRMDSPGVPKCTTNGIGLSFLGQSNKMTFSANDARTYHLGGYSLQFSGINQSNVTIDDANPRLILGTNEVSGTINGSFTPTVCSGGSGGAGDEYSINEWHRVRFDMIPIGAVGVTLNAYTSSAGDVASGLEVWELIGTTFINSTDAVYIDPTLPANGMGFYAWRDDQNDNPDDSVLIDQFEILVEDI